ncbi:high-affinity nickel-transporter [Phialemonium atrogriseum]|uniref:Nickel/cobalt efflux system n=1 Tax=Phialemonium atrogriseum TaxID=1093897 RepID=A0AAJ0BYW1_9PEZI|nr:high-affinity nickel-transporter [Phialemonium atrogriseum]KAK1765592.1 high-affinity nickel-transporter [Phialemonium atrogriseum]
MARLNFLRSPKLNVPPFLRAIPVPALRLIGLLIVVNLVVWAASGVVLRYNPKLISSAVLSYTLGLRHALDADHISAIDLMTRRLIAAGQRPVSVGTFFSLGHSTIVVVTCVVVAATSGALRDRFDNFQRVGGIIGTSVSAAFLLLLCAGNGWVLWRLVRSLKEELALQRAVRDGSSDAEGAGDDDDDDGGRGAAGHLRLEAAGCMATVFRKVFKIVDRPWKMFPLGVLFGLGFDTSSEIAILGIAGIQGAQGTNIWVILIFPILFTAGMCLLDTTDGALMMALYTNKAFARDTVAILYYSIVLTGITVFVAAFIGIIQVLTLVENVAEPEGSFWDGVSAIGDHFEIIGGSICGLFLLVGLGSVVVYKPWRRRMDRRNSGAVVASDESEEAAPGLAEASGTAPDRKSALENISERPAA